MSGVYAITDGTYHKIGVADDPMKRVRELQVGNPRPLTLVFYIRAPSVDAYVMERNAHRRMGADLRASGEWFDCTLEQAIIAILPMRLTLELPEGAAPLSVPVEDDDGLL